MRRPVGRSRSGAAPNRVAKGRGSAGAVVKVPGSSSRRAGGPAARQWPDGHHRGAGAGSLLFVYVDDDAVVPFRNRRLQGAAHAVLDDQFERGFARADRVRVPLDRNRPHAGRRATRARGGSARTAAPDGGDPAERHSHERQHPLGALTPAADEHHPTRLAHVLAATYGGWRRDHTFEPRRQRDAISRLQPQHSAVLPKQCTSYQRVL